MIASCGALGLDWERTSLSMFIEGVEAHNASMSPDKDREPASPEFRDFMRRHFEMTAAKGGPRRP